MAGGSYRTNQFYNFDKKVAGRGGLRQGGPNDPISPTNEKFLYPGPVHHRAGPGGKLEKVKVKRGFMRLLTPKEIRKDVPNYKFFFQFNPQAIQRDVAMSMEIRNPFLQSPEELAQPLFGQTGFQFDMMIDRSFEINGSEKPLAPFLGPLADWGSEDLLATLGPESIGVLSDIRMLDTIVGQGISRALFDFMTDQARNSYNIANGQQTATQSGTSASATTDPFDETTFRANLEANVGNQAFLLPNPVRVVFSSLFMVDGYVTQMNVKYVRFTDSMVPITATIGVQMYAMYIGFARSDTPLQKTLNAGPKNGSGSGSGTAKSDNPDYGAALALATQHLSRIRIAVGGRYGAFGTSGSNRPPFSYSDLDDYENNRAYHVSHYSNPDLSVGYEFLSLPEDRGNKNNDPIYKALSTQDPIIGISLSNVFIELSRKAYSNSEKAQLGEDGTVVTLRINTGEIFNATGTDADQIWWSQTTHNEDFSASKNGEDWAKATNDAWVAPEQGQQHKQQLLLGDTQWSQFKSDTSNDSVLRVRGNAEVVLTLVDGTTIKLIYDIPGVNLIRYDDIVSFSSAFRIA